MPNQNLPELTKFINLLADASGAVIRKYYRNFGNAVLKDDLSPVTVADKEAEQAIIELIKKNYPEHGIQGEEFGTKNANAKFKWIIDPIDGTISFMIGRPIFGTLIALSYEDKSMIGIIDQPIIGDRWVAVENKTLLNGKEIKVRNCNNITNAVIATTAPQYFSTEKLLKFNNISSKAMSTIYGGDCYNYGLLAAGMLDAVIESGLKPHDFMALIPVVECAGGIATDWQGKPLNINSNGDVVFCGDKKLHTEIIEILK
jgi:histidinol phosphatase-like enzyme (inositol monophosphatase family)